VKDPACSSNKDALPVYDGLCLKDIDPFQRGGSHGHDMIQMNGIRRGSCSTRDIPVHIGFLTDAILVPICAAFNDILETVEYTDSVGSPPNAIHGNESSQDGSEESWVGGECSDIAREQLQLRCG
jgi:hypothetical protein